MKKSKQTPSTDPRRRLQLDKEKVRELQQDDLGDVAGGGCAKTYLAPPNI